MLCVPQTFLARYLKEQAGDDVVFKQTYTMSDLTSQALFDVKDKVSLTMRRIADNRSCSSRAADGVSARWCVSETFIPWFFPHTFAT